MKKATRVRYSLAALLFTAIFVAGCAGDPLKKLLVQRMNYKVELISWTWKGETGSGEVILDFMIHNGNDYDRLDTLTVSFEEEGEDGKLIRKRNVPLNVGKIPPGERAQISVVVRDVSPEVEKGGVWAGREANPPKEQYKEMPEFKAFVGQ